MEQKDLKMLEQVIQMMKREMVTQVKWGEVEVIITHFSPKEELPKVEDANINTDDIDPDFYAANGGGFIPPKQPPTL